MSEPTKSATELFNLRGRVALVAGGTGHLGPAIAAALAEAGASVALTSRSLDRAKDVASSLSRVGDAEHRGWQLDYMDAASVERCFGEVVSGYGHVDILVANAHEPVGGDWAEVSAEQFGRELNNATAYFLLSRLMHNHAAAQCRPASIILIASMYGLVGSYPDVYEGLEAYTSPAYHVLKGGIAQLTRHLAVYWARDRVRVNCISPGPFCRPVATPEFVRRLTEKVPMARVARPEEIKGAILFLASDAGSFVTGHNLIVDGGWTAW